MSDSKDLPDFCLAGRVAVVTGAVGILGSVYCKALAGAGATVVVADLDQEKCDAFAAELPGKGHVGMAVDLSSESAIVSWASAIKARWGAVDILVNNAATKSPNMFAPLGEFPLEDWNQCMGVNLTGVFLVTRELGPAMAERGKGSIINIASIYGVVGPDQRIYEGSYYEAVGGPINTPMVYSAAKGAVVAMTKYLATYWGARGV
jgi:NAD(P)-dependent dehydrogenase (short-subunit alcohol dehydrogenase family)